MKNRTFWLGKEGPHLWTRELAQKMRSEMFKQLESLEPGGVLVIDAEGVEVFDFSFANEFFGKSLLAVPREFPGRFLAVMNLSGYARENLERALEGLSLVILEFRGARPDLLGEVHPVYRDTFATLAEYKRPTPAAELKDRLGLTVTAMNERLSKLTALGVVGRDRGASSAGREQYLYWAPRQN